MKHAKSIKYQLLILFFILLAAFMTPQPAHAQFWKKLFGHHKKEHRKDKNESFLKNLNNKEKTVNLADFLPPTTKKNRYRIDVLLPLDLDNYVQNGKVTFSKVPNAVKPALNFYEGLLLATKKLDKEQLKIDLHIHDVGNLGSKLKTLIQDSSLNQSDLIICFLQSGQLPAIAKYAKARKINLISALSPSDADISGNPFFIMLQPTLKIHINQLVRFAEKKYKGKPIILLYADQTPVQKESKKLLEKALKGRTIKYVAIKTFLNDSTALLSKADSMESNVLFVNLLAPRKAEQVLKKLSLNADKFIVFGMPSWKYIPSLTQSGAFPNLDIYFTNPYYFNIETGKGQRLASRYKTEFGGSPSEMAFRGYETLYWTAHLLKSYGTIFNLHLSNTQMAPFTRFKIKAIWYPKKNIDYLENENLYFFHYANGIFNLSR